MKKILTYYCFLLISFLTLTAFLRAASFAHIISAIIFFPLFVFFAESVFPRKKKLIAVQAVEVRKSKKRLSKKEKESALASLKEIPLIQEISEKFENIDLGITSQSDNRSTAENGEVIDEGVDVNRRVLLKIIVSAGTGLFMMSLFTKKAHAAFFGSVPGPGTISIKDSNDVVIDPAIKTPTDGYKISEVDDASSPAYYGFVDKNGAWFIMKEESSGAYRYTKGSSSFSTNWTGRAGLTYGYFDSIF